MICSTVIGHFDDSLSTIWEIITNNHNTGWRKGLSKVEIIDEFHFREYDSHGFVTTFTITTKEPHKQYDLSFENENLIGTSFLSFQTLDCGQIEIVFREEVKVKKWLLTLVAKPYLKKQQKTYLNDLKKALQDRRNK